MELILEDVQVAHDFNAWLRNYEDQIISQLVQTMIN